MPDHETPALRVTEVYQRFDSGVVALDDVNLSVAPGEFVSIVGPSGCGKSTLLRLASGLLSPTSGTVDLRGTRVSEPRQDAALMFQRPTLLPWRDSTENVLLPLELRGSVTRTDRDEARRLLALVGLSGFEHSYPQHLSGGMQQRVALARLLILGVDVLFLDEPFGAVDEFTREKLNVELLRIHATLKPTIVLVTHNISESVFLADRVVAMTPRPGKIAKIVPIPLPRPRGLSTMQDPRFATLVNDVRDAFGTEVAA